MVLATQLPRALSLPSFSSTTIVALLRRDLRPKLEKNFPDCNRTIDDCNSTDIQSLMVLLQYRKYVYSFGIWMLLLSNLIIFRLRRKDLRRCASYEPHMSICLPLCRRQDALCFSDSLQLEAGEPSTHRVRQQKPDAI